MKKVVFLGDTLLNDEPLGIQRYAYEILKQLDALKVDYVCEVLIPEHSECKIHFDNIKVIKYGRQRIGFWWRQIDFPHYVRKNHAIGVDLTLGLPFMGCDVACLHDCINENYPQNSISIKNKIKRYNYLIRAAAVVKKAKTIITVSEYSKNELIDHYRLPSDKIVVIYNAWQHYAKIEPDYSIIKDLKLYKGTFCFSLGSSLPHKNFRWIIAAAIQNPEYQFVVTGTNRLCTYKEKINVDKIPNIVFTGFLPDGQVKALMECCRVFLHPSNYEGFGIPPLEALSCGTEIAVSNKTCLPEIYKDNAHYFDPSDYDNIRIDQILSTQIKKSCDILTEFTWDKSAKKMNDVLMHLV